MTDAVQVLHADGSRIAWRHQRTSGGGRGRPTLLFFHALATDGGIWDATVDAFADSADSLVFDLPGHGRSTCAPDQSFTFDALAALACRLLDKLSISRVHAIGVSVGGEVAQAFAARHADRIDRLVLSSTACHTAPPRARLWAERIAEVAAGGMADIAPATARRWFSPAYAAAHPEAVDACARTIAATDRTAYLRLAAVIARMDLREANRLIAAPTLLTFGSEDGNTGAAAAAEIAASIADTRTIRFDGSGHFPHIEDAAAWNRAVAAFLFGPA